MASNGNANTSTGKDQPAGKSHSGKDSKDADYWKQVADDLTRLIEKTNALIFGIDASGHVNDWNEKTEKMTGFSKLDAIGKPFVNTFIQQSNRPALAAVLDMALRGRETANYELPLLSKDGNRYTVLLNTTTRRNANGEITGVFGVGQDITDLEAAMAKSKMIADDLTRLIETANAPIIGVDMQGLVTEWNAKSAELLGFDKSETMGKALVATFISDEFKHSVNEVFSLALMGKETANFEFPLFTKHGERRELLLNATTRRSINGEIIGVIGVGQDITRIREITKQQERIADDLSRLIDTANAPIFGVDVNGKITEWNRMAAQMLGYTKGETLGKELVHGFIQPENRKSVSEVLEKALSGSETANFALPLLSKFGENYTVLLNATTRRDAEGNITGVVGVGQDITQLNKAMAESKRVADDLTRLIETANAPIFGVDTQGRVTEWNQKLADLSQFSKAETLGKPLVANFIAPEYGASVSFVLLKALHGEGTASFELPLVKSGEVKAVLLLNATTRRGSDGQVVGVICVGQEVTQIKTMTAEQQRIAADLARLIDHANAPIFGVDTKGMITEWNRKAAEILGFKKEEVMGKNLVQTFIQPAEQASVTEVLEKALRNVETANYELPLMSKSGVRYTILLNATSRRDAEGKVVGVVGVGQDITALNQVLAESKRVADDWVRLIETANAPIFGVDTQGNVTEWNAKASSLLGFSKHETIGKSLVGNFITDEFKESVNDVLTAAILGKETANFEFTIFTKSDDRKELLLNATTRRGPGGEVTGVIGVGQDITRIREVTREQERVADDLSRLIETANAPIFGIDVNGLVNEWNMRAAAMLGYSKQEAMGRRFVLTFIQPESRHSVSEVLNKALSGIETANFELLLVSRHDKRFTVLLNATTRRNAQGAITGVVGVGQDITELKDVLAESKRVAEDLTRLIDTANAPIFGIDTLGKVSEWNAKAASLLGISKEEAMGQSLVERFITQDFQQSVADVLAAALVGKETANFEFPMFTKYGERKDILLNATTRRGPDGEVVGVIGVGQDITRIREITVEQQRTADDLTRLIDSANAPIFGVDTEGMVTEWNRKAAQILGFSKDEAIGKNLVQTFIQPEDRQSVSDVLGKALRGAETANYELPLVSKHKQRYTVLLNATTRRDAKGEVTGVVGVGQDITELRQIMAESKRVADDLVRLIETANAPIFGIDTLGKVNEWNAKAARLLGIPKEEAMGKPFVASFITTEFKASVNEVLAQALIGKDTADFEFTMFNRDGDRKDVLLNATARRGPDGEVIGVIGVGQDITRIREITSEQERIASDLSRLIESANAPIFGVDLSGKVTEWNKKAADMLGYNKQETIGRHFVSNFIQPEHRQSVNDVLQRALAGDETSNFELSLMSKVGERFTVLLNATTRRDGNGFVTGVVGVGQDITQLNKVMKESAHVADDLSRLIESANAPIFGIDTEGNVSEWNKMTAEISGFSKKEAMGKHLVTSFIHQDHRASVAEVLQKAVQGHESSNYELPLFTKSGLRRDILLNITTRRSATGDIIGVVSVGQDITDIKRASEREKRTAHDLTQLIETANAPILGIDTEGRVNVWNAKATEVSSFTKAETMGRHLVNTFIHLEYRASVAEVLQSALSGKEVANFELILFTKDGKRREVLLNATPRRGDDGSVVGVLGVGQDITELNQQRKEALRIADDLGRIIETANAPIFGIDVHGLVTEWNIKLAELSEFTKEEAMGKSFVHNFITEKVQDTVSRELLRALNGETTSSFELPLVKNGVAKATVLLNATTRRGPNREVIGVICVGQDITRLSALTEEQRAIADDLRRLIDSANAPIFGVDVNGMVTEWNRKAADMLGYTNEETIGKKLVQNFIQPENRDAVEKVLQNALTGRETANYALPLMAKYGKRYTVLLNATTRRDAKGRIVGVVGVGQDITELNQVMADSKRIADDLTRLIETANAPIFGIDTNGHVNEWNAKASQLLGYSKDEAMGKSLVANFITEEFKSAVHEVLAQALVGKETANFEFPVFTKLGERKELLLNATTRRGPGGEVIGVIGVGQDITRIRDITKEQMRIADDLSRLIEFANAPIFGVDLDGMVTEWNRKAADILGYTKEETIGKHLTKNFIQPENRQSVDTVLQKANAGHETANFELPLLSKSNQRLTVLLNATTRRDAKGQAIGVVGVGQDITELNHVMAESKRVADDLTRLIETANAPIFGIDRKGKVTEWNRMVSDITDYTKEEALGEDLVAKFISEEYKQSVSNVLKMALHGLETANFEFPLFTKNKDRKIQILMSATPRRGPDGHVIGVLGVGQDITDLRAAKEAADRQSEELRRLVKSANAPIFGVDQSYRITEWNDMMGKISGMKEGDLIGTPLASCLYDPGSKQSVEKVLRDTLDGKPTENFELRLSSRDQSGRRVGQVTLLLSASARLDPTGNIVGVMSIGQDITEHKALEDRKMRFMAVVSHELRSPIHGIYGLSESLAANETDDGRQKMLNMITRCSKRLLDLVTNIMDISSIRSKTLRLNKSVIDLVSIMEETVHILGHAIDKHGKLVKHPHVRLTNDLRQGAIPKIEGDAHRCTQVFYNLVMNALKFTREGEVRVSGETDYTGGNVHIHITDTGVGIAPANMERIFEAFEQEDTDKAAPSLEGIGLGLPISREVVRRHGGEITVSSVLGQGSTFTVQLPIKSKEPIEDSLEGEKEKESKTVRKELQSAPVPVPPPSRQSSGAVPRVPSANLAPQPMPAPAAAVAAPAQPAGVDSSRNVTQQLVPIQLMSQVNLGDKNVSLEHSKLTVVLFNIVDWHENIEGMSANQTVVVLNQLFAAFEALAAANKMLFRVEATCVAYLMMVAIEDVSDAGGAQLVAFAFSMLQTVRRIKMPSGKKLQLRVGIHTGSANSGIVGVTRQNFHLFGPSPGVAAQIESKCVPGCISVSEEASKELSHVLTDDKLPKGCRLVGKRRTKLIVPDWIPDAALEEPAVVPQTATKAVVQMIPGHTSPYLETCPDTKGPWYVLSVDDDDVNQHVIGGMFGAQGFSIAVAMDGYECLDHMEKAENGEVDWPHIILLDSMMPGMGGVDVCKKLRQKHNPLELPVIMLTCRTAAEDVEEAITAGCNEYVTKPFNRIELLARVRGLMRVSRVYWHQKQIISDLQAAVAKAPSSAPPPQPAPAPAPAPAPVVKIEPPRPQAAAASPARMVSDDISDTPTVARRGPAKRLKDTGSEDLGARSESLMSEIHYLQSKCRELERTNWTAKSELAACKAALAQAQAEAEHVWGRLAAAEDAGGSHHYLIAS